MENDDSEKQLSSEADAVPANLDRLELLRKLGTYADCTAPVFVALLSREKGCVDPAPRAPSTTPPPSGLPAK